MSQIIKTKIDGVDVEIEFTTEVFNPVTETTTTATTTSAPKSPAIIDLTKQVKIIKVGEGKPEELAKVKAAIESENKTPTEFLQDLLNSLQNVQEGKNWWESKVVWINVISIVAATLTHFGITTFKFDPQLFDMIFPCVIAIVNMYLRKGTKTPLSNKVVPHISLFK